MEVGLLCPAHSSRTSCWPPACGHFILGFKALANTQSWKRTLSNSQEHQVFFCGSRGINSPQRPVSGFWGTARCELEVEGQQGHTQGCSLGRMRHKLQVKRANLCVSAQIWKQSSFSISSYHLLTVDGAMQGTLGWRGVVVLFLNMWKTGMYFQESEMSLAWDNSPFIPSPGWDCD